jgi:hypothetical protein
MKYYTTKNVVKTPIMIENEDYHYRSTYVFDRGNWLTTHKRSKTRCSKKP